MKGVVFTLLNEFVENSFSMQVWDKVLATSGESGAYTAANSYSDSSLLKLVHSLQKHTGIGANQLIRTFGEYMFRSFAEQYPYFFPENVSVQGVLSSVDEIIHIEVRKLFPGVELPRFEHEFVSNNRMLLTYRSRRSLCVLAEGLINGTAKHFGESILHRQIKCMHHGDDHCVFDITFRGKAEC